MSTRLALLRDMRRRPRANSAQLDGLGSGLAAGVVLMFAEIVMSIAHGLPATWPLRVAGSVLLGRTALATPDGPVIFVGVLAHATMSAIFGTVYGALQRRQIRVTQLSHARQAAFGLAFGAAIAVLDLQLLAPTLLPWIDPVSPLAQVVVHALAFGLPLGLSYATTTHWSRRPHLALVPLRVAA